MARLPALAQAADLRRRDRGTRSATVCHLGNIAMRLGRKLRWDTGSEQFLGDEEANRFLMRPMRHPWSL
ncbi:MAG: hypothetical protein U1E76_16625 [Planctomycetota bacterium]